MGYAEHNLISGESITYRGRLHLIVLARAIVATVLLDAIAVALIVVGFSQKSPSIYIWAGILLMLVSGAVLGSALLVRNAAEFVITNKRVVVKMGIVHKRTAEMFLHKIESVGVDQSLAGRIWGFGTISVHGTGGSVESFQRIANPFEFRRQIQEQIGVTTGRAAALSN
ncbi:MAG TPA: PH domain-containing protein [Terriglobales bacterium]|nr:PH domain-containing protein [Terriglobales bacterium]